MSGRIWAVAALSLASVFALLQCGGSVVAADGSGAGGATGIAGQGHGGQLGQAGHAGQSTMPRAGAAGLPLDAGFDEYADPGCPEAGPSTEVTECDPFSTNPGCPAGEGCFPFVDHPFGEGCGAQTFGTQCLQAGDGRQGDFCGDGTGRCASGFVCVVGSQPGKHCVQLCHLGMQNVCPAGMICGELDVEGYGVCS
ncbi:MAG: hypothetical protein ABJB12_14595 [Pseudomonadota bacterium]